jgi:alpha-amylase
VTEENPLLPLYRAQCNDAYWHGVFGGLYLPHLRHALYENLIKAELLYDQERHTEKEWVESERLDLNGDGDEEIILKNPETVFLFGSRSGSLLEMDFRPKAFNILGTLTRRKEGYHQKLFENHGDQSKTEGRTIHEIFDSKETHLDRYLHFDDYRRASFLDHFIAGPMDFESFRKGLYSEEGDFINGLYEMDIRRKAKNQEVIFSRLGTLSQNKKKHPVRIEKRFIPSLDQSLLKTIYQITFSGEKTRRTNFGIEFNINLLAADALDRYYSIPGHPLEDHGLASRGELGGVSEIHLIDEWTGLNVFLNISKDCHLWRFPVETVSLSESGFEKIFQGSCLLAYWPLELASNQPFEVTIELGVKSL